MLDQQEIELKWKLAQKTSLWARTLGSTDEYVIPLKDSFLQARKNAIFLLDKIKKDFPYLTIHDITHVDSLWNVADTIIGEEYPINPLEGYVLGIAFLIHDVALSYDAVGGVDNLRKTIEWKDAYAYGSGDKNEEDFKKECDFIAIRSLHAKKAENILSQKFERENKSTFYIISKDEYRVHFGDIIGKIAASHHWNIHQVESKLDTQINPIAGFPRDWDINALKLACILRCADAGHIDCGRAPYGIYKSLIINGVSRDHWEAQSRLGQVKEDRESPKQLLITSTRPFTKEYFAAWNVAYDAVRLFDKELKNSYNLLNTVECKTFCHNAVSGADSKENLAKYIKADAWQPCDIRVHTSNLKFLIENLGGSKLYGKRNLLPIVLRELIQNARDAIYARHIMTDFKEGKIIVRLIEKDRKRWIEVEDNGMGMSANCIKYHLLNFGSSYWISSLCQDENPGLRSRKFTSIGKFGIGFYSIFMVAKSVEVISRVYKDGESDAKIVEFPSGLTLSPIISNTTLNINISTLIRFELKDEVDTSFNVVFNKKSISLQKALSIVTAGLDVDVYFEKDENKKCIHTNIKSHFDEKEWLKGLILQPIADDSIKRLANRLEKISDENNSIIGYIAIPDEDYNDNILPSIETVSGLVTSVDIVGQPKGYVGYFNFRETDISRKNIVLDNNTTILIQRWLKKKYNDEYPRIVLSRALSKNYFLLMQYCNMNLEEIAVRNMEVIYSTYLQNNIEIGTVKGLKDIHMKLFSGISDFAGRFRIHNTHLYYIEKHIAPEIEFLDETLKSIDKMPEDCYENIISKYLKTMIVHAFEDGNKRAAGIWVNLMLKRFNNKMINWGIIDTMEYLKKLQLFCESGLIEPMCEFLRSYLTTGRNRCM